MGSKLCPGGCGAGFQRCTAGKPVLGLGASLVGVRPQQHGLGPEDRSGFGLIRI